MTEKFVREDRVTIAPVLGGQPVTATIIATSGEWASVRPDGDTDTYKVRLDRLSHLEGI